MYDETDKTFLKLEVMLDSGYYYDFLQLFKSFIRTLDPTAYNLERVNQLRERKHGNFKDIKDILNEPPEWVSLAIKMKSILNVQKVYTGDMKGYVFPKMYKNSYDKIVTNFKKCKYEKTIEHLSDLYLRMLYNSNTDEEIITNVIEPYRYLALIGTAGYSVTASEFIDKTEEFLEFENRVKENLNLVGFKGVVHKIRNKIQRNAM